MSGPVEITLDNPDGKGGRPIDARLVVPDGNGGWEDAPLGGGSVQTVAGQEPDEDGNVALTHGSLGPIQLGDLGFDPETQAEFDAALATIQQAIDAKRAIADSYTKAQVDSAIAAAGGGSASTAQPQPRGLSLSKTGQLLSKSGSGQESAFIESPNVFWDPLNRRWGMVYVGYSGTVGSPTQAAAMLAHAPSPAGPWVKDGVLLSASGSGVDSNGVSGPSIIYANGLYHLFYIGLTANGYEGGTKTMCLATASTLGGTWTRRGAVISPSGSGWRQGAIWHRSIVKKGSTYFMFFNAGDASAVESIGYATSTDLLTWTVNDANSPVLSKGGAGTWESTMVGDPSVYRIGDDWFMAYFGYNGTSAGDGVAWTSDANFPLGWTKSPENPILKPGATGTFDAKFAHKPMVVEEAGVHYHFYTAVDTSDVRSLGLAVATPPVVSTAPGTLFGANRRQPINARYDLQDTSTSASPAALSPSSEVAAPTLTLPTSPGVAFGEAGPSGRKAMRFPGTRAYLSGDLPMGAQWQASKTGIVFSTWLYMPSTANGGPADGAFIFSLQSNLTGTSDGVGILVGGDGNLMQFNHGVAFTAAAVGTVPLNTWVHLAGQVGSAGLTHFWINGAWNRVTGSIGAWSMPTTPKLIIGNGGAFSSGAGGKDNGTTGFRLSNFLIGHDSSNMASPTIGAYLLDFTEGRWPVVPAVEPRIATLEAGRPGRSTATGSATIAATTSLQAVSGSAANTQTLPAASAVSAGREVVVKDANGTAATNNITVARAGSDTIDGGTSVAITSNYGVARLYSDGVSKWFTA